VPADFAQRKLFDIRAGKYSSKVHLVDSIPIPCTGGFACQLPVVYFCGNCKQHPFRCEKHQQDHLGKDASHKPSVRKVYTEKSLVERLWSNALKKSDGQPAALGPEQVVAVASPTAEQLLVQEQVQAAAVHGTDAQDRDSVAAHFQAEANSEQGTISAGAAFAVAAAVEQKTAESDAAAGREFNSDEEIASGGCAGRETAASEIAEQNSSCGSAVDRETVASDAATYSSSSDVSAAAPAAAPRRRVLVSPGGGSRRKYHTRWCGKQGDHPKERTLAYAQYHHWEHCKLCENGFGDPL
jgi:hypothetical protein